MATAKEVITEALHLFGILDSAEVPQASDFTKCVPILNKMLRTEYMDAAVQYLIKRMDVQLPPGVAGQVYSFSVGPSSDVAAVDAVAVRAIWLNDINNTVNRETRMAPIADVIRTTNIGIITKWHQERQLDGSILVTAWQPPRASSKAIIEYGARVAEIVDENSVVGVPPEGVHDVTLLFGRRICSSYGRAFEATSPVAIDAAAVDARWRQWARGQQWLRFVRA